MNDFSMIELVVANCRAEALDVVSFELRPPNGGVLPAFEAGSHLEIVVPGIGRDEFIRHYSLCNGEDERYRYIVAVGRVQGGRGGSDAAHQFIRKGSIISLRNVRNNFPLARDAERYRFIAGGIGITPILSMVRWCEDNNREWSLLYCARSKNRAAFYEDLLQYGPKVHFHFDDDVRGSKPNLARELAYQRGNEHLYCCGPQGLMQAVKDACASWIDGHVHFEWFTASTDHKLIDVENNVGFSVVLRSSGKRIEVRSDQTILASLEAAGVEIPSSCREGLCGTCETKICDGAADHRDFVLSDADRAAQKSLMVCVSRARSDILVLDI